LPFRNQLQRSKTSPSVKDPLCFGAHLNVSRAALAEGVGSFALNQARFLTTTNVNYKFPRSAFSADIAITHFGSYPASLDDVAQGPAATLVALGGRYHFRILGAPATLRVQVQNLTNAYFWNLSYSAPQFTQYQPRAFFGYVTADF